MDFFSDMAVNVTLSPVSATVGTVPAPPALIVANDSFWLNSDGSSVSTVNPIPANCVGVVCGEGTLPVPPATLGVYTKYTQKYVDLAGNPVVVGSAASNYVRYAEYPGQRLFKKVKFEVNGELDCHEKYLPKQILVACY